MILPEPDILFLSPCMSRNRSEPFLTPVVDLQPGLHQGQGDGPLHQGADLHDRLSSWHTHVMASCHVTQDLCLSSCFCSPLGTVCATLPRFHYSCRNRHFHPTLFCPKKKLRNYLKSHHFIASSIL